MGLNFCEIAFQSDYFKSNFHRISTPKPSPFKHLNRRTALYNTTQMFCFKGTVFWSKTFENRRTKLHTMVQKLKSLLGILVSEIKHIRKNSVLNHPSNANSPTWLCIHKIRIALLKLHIGENRYNSNISVPHDLRFKQDKWGIEGLSNVNTTS